MKLGGMKHCARPSGGKPLYHFIDVARVSSYLMFVDWKKMKTAPSAHSADSCTSSHMERQADELQVSTANW